MTRADVAVIGAGILGLATARALVLQRRGLSVVVVDKEDRVAAHQTGHNSGVIHAGIYYAPGSLKARLSVEGGRHMMEYCAAQGIPVGHTGKVVVATDASQVPALDELERRAAANGVDTVRLDSAGIAAHEPHAAGVAGLHVPVTSIVDFSQVAAAFAADAAAGGAEIRTGFAVTAATDTGRAHRLESPGGWVEASVVVNCAGLHVDRLARMMGSDTLIRIVPFRGEYFRVKPERAHLVKGLIYPVPDPRFPFLGVHFTRTVHGAVEIGPNAVLATAREGYRRTTFRAEDLWETLRTPGFRRLARANWRTGAAEVRRSLIASAFVADAARLVPELRRDDLGDFRAGVRAQAVTPDGALLHDFAIEETGRAIHVLNAPSPGATASLAIGEHIAERALAKLEAP